MVGAMHVAHSARNSTRGSLARVTDGHRAIGGRNEQRVCHGDARSSNRTSASSTGRRSRGRLSARCSVSVSSTGSGWSPDKLERSDAQPSAQVQTTARVYVKAKFAWKTRLSRRAAGLVGRATSSSHRPSSDSERRQPVPLPAASEGHTALLCGRGPARRGKDIRAGAVANPPSGLCSLTDGRLRPSLADEVDASRPITQAGPSPPERGGEARRGAAAPRRSKSRGRQCQKVQGGRHLAALMCAAPGVQVPPPVRLAGARRRETSRPRRPAEPTSCSACRAQSSEVLPVELPRQVKCRRPMRQECTAASQSLSGCANPTTHRQGPARVRTRAGRRRPSERTAGSTTEALGGVVRPWQQASSGRARSSTPVASRNLRSGFRLLQHGRRLRIERASHRNGLSGSPESHLRRCSAGRACSH